MVRAPPATSVGWWWPRRRDTVIGFAGLLDLGSCVALSDLFVRPDRQSHGVGAALLDEVLPRGRPCVTMASADPRAVASYARRGMRPRWPAYYLSATAGQVREGPWPALAVRRAGPRGVRLAVAGRRPVPRARSAPGRWPSTGTGVRLGTALVVDGSPQRLFHPDTTEVLETTVDDADDAAPVVLAVVAHLLDAGASRLVVQVPGPHGALAPLLERGFAITDVDTACASEEGLLADPTRHTMHGESRVATGVSPRRSGSATAG